MSSETPKPEELRNLEIPSLGKSKINTPLTNEISVFVDDNQKSLIHNGSRIVEDFLSRNELPPMFELAGPRSKIFFSPKKCE